MLDIYAAQKAAQALAGKAGLRVQFHDRGTDQYCTDASGTLYIPRPGLDWDKDQTAMWRNGYSHELGHWIPGNRDVFPLVTERKIDMSTLFGIALNCVDDVRNDRVRCETYPGMVADHVAATAQIVRRNWSKPIDPAMPAENKVVLTLAAGMVACHALENDKLAACYDALRESLDAQCSAWLDTMDRDGWLARWYALETGEQEYAYVSELLREVFKLSPEETGESEHTEPGKGDKDGDKDGKGKGKGKPADGDADGEECEGEADGESEPTDKESKGTALRPTVNYDDLLRLPSHSKERAEEREHGTRIDYSTSINTDGYDPHTATTTTVKVPDMPVKPRVVTKLEETITETNVRDIAGTARRYLQAETRKRDMYNQKSGKLDTRKLSKAATYRGSDVPAVFKTPAPKREINTAVSILVDGSGSMRGEDKYFLACAAGYGMAQICQSFNVPCEIAIFSELDSNENAHYLVKQWHERADERLIVDRFSAVSDYMLNNADGDSILVAYSRLIQRQEAKRILVVMSDGSPAGYRPGNLYRYTAKVIERIERERTIDIMGVGILDNNVSGLYKNHSVVWNPAEIPAKLIEVLKANITL